MRRLFLLILGVGAAVCFADPHPVDPVGFKTLNEAVLAPKCVRCHEEYRTEEGLAADIVPGNPDSSPLYRTIAEGKMPRGAPLSPDLVSMVRRYIEKSSAPQSSTPMIDLKHVTLQKLRSDIFEARCVKCHDKYKSDEGILADIEPGDPGHSILYNYVARGRMPRDGFRYQNGKRPPGKYTLTKNQIDAIRTFILRLPPKHFPPVSPTWASLKANLFQRSCVTCHSDGGPAGDHPFETRAEVKSMGSEILAIMLDSREPMPAAHTTAPPTPKLIRAFKKWIALERR